VLYAPPPQPSAITITETSNCTRAPSVSVNSKTWVHSPGYYQKEADDFRNKLERPEQQCRPELLLSTGASVIHLICRQERQERELRIRLSYREVTYRYVDRFFPSLSSIQFPQRSRRPAPQDFHEPLVRVWPLRALVGRPGGGKSVLSVIRGG
jgi:hypothetical protein